jgi:hypothetical protein
MTTNISADHRSAFGALISGDYANFALFSWFVNGEPATAIVARDEDGDGYAITPVFVSGAPSLILTDHDGTPASGEQSVCRFSPVAIGSPPSRTIRRWPSTSSGMVGSSSQ